MSSVGRQAPVGQMSPGAGYNERLENKQKYVNKPFQGFVIDTINYKFRPQPRKGFQASHYYYYYKI